MLVDRNLILDLIVLESKRENGYRHPHCIIVTYWSIRASRELYEEHPCTGIELIEESFDSISWLCVISLCIDCYAYEYLLPVIRFLLYAVYVISWFIEFWKEEWMSFNCFSNWTREFLQGVQLNLSARSAWLQGSIRERFYPHSSQNCRFSTEAVQGMRRLDEDSELRFWAKSWRISAAGVRRIKDFIT